MIHNNQELAAQIALLERQRDEEITALKSQIIEESMALNPLNLIGSGIRQVGHSEAIQDRFVNSSVAMIASFLVNATLIGETKNPLKLVLGNMIQMGVTQFFYENPEVVKTLQKKVLTTIHSTEIKPIHSME